MKHPNIISTGSTRSGKSEREARRLVEAAEEGCSIVLEDPHKDSLAARTFEHLVARGMKRRIIFDRTTEVDRTPGYDFLRKPIAATRLEYLRQVEELTGNFADVLLRRRGM